MGQSFFRCIAILVPFVHSIAFHLLCGEYAGCARITTKLDAYNYIIVILEMVSGISLTYEMLGDSMLTTLPNWMEKGVKENNPLRSITNQFLKCASNESLEEILEMLKLGLACSTKTPQNHPTTKSMNVLDSKERA
eukprot:Gb_05429 [translate_table: standard]